ncbi:glucuronyl hydrolase [Bacteroidales bacterium]|nr:glucuronyl hydrolase [Bacteroidales bacterium]
MIAENLSFATLQTEQMLQGLNGKTDAYPRTMDEQGNLVTTGMYDWTPGFFPGSLWYLYEMTGDKKWETQALEWTKSLEPLKTFTRHHDLGFMMYCSYGNAYRLNPTEESKAILIESAKSLSSRYSPITASIKSWNYRKSWDDSTEWFYPVIIDNIMNLELLFFASKASGDPTYYDIALAHANTSLKNHFRPDYSSYHVVDYDTLTGDVKARQTCQGYSDNSTWARGQAWAIYGYTMTYRETKDARYLEAVIKMCDWYLNHPNLPADKIPYWDFNVDQEGYTPDKKSYAYEFREKLRDVSAAAIVCSALFELSELANRPDYNKLGIEMLKTLSSPTYRASLGTNANFILGHSVGSIPHKNEIDKPLVYADYYFLEALSRYKNMNKN